MVSSATGVNAGQKATTQNQESKTPLINPHFEKGLRILAQVVDSLPENSQGEARSLIAERFQLSLPNATTGKVEEVAQALVAPQVEATKKFVDVSFNEVSFQNVVKGLEAFTNASTPWKDKVENLLRLINGDIGILLPYASDLDTKKEKAAKKLTFYFQHYNAGVELLASLQNLEKEVLDLKQQVNVAFGNYKSTLEKQNAFVIALFDKTVQEHSTLHRELNNGFRLLAQNNVLKPVISASKVEKTEVNESNFTVFVSSLESLLTSLDKFAREELRGHLNKVAGERKFLIPEDTEIKNEKEVASKLPEAYKPLADRGTALLVDLEQKKAELGLIQAALTSVLDKHLEEIKKRRATVVELGNTMVQKTQELDLKINGKYTSSATIPTFSANAKRIVESVEEKPDAKEETKK